MAHERGVPLAGYRVAGPDLVYLQYRALCRERFEFSRSLLSELFPSGSVGVSDEPVTPNHQTIQLFGPSWRDQPSGWDDD